MTWRSARWKRALQNGATLDSEVEDIDFSVRAYNCLKNGDIRTMRDLTTMTRQDMLRVTNLGKITLAEIEEALSYFGGSFLRSRPVNLLAAGDAWGRMPVEIPAWRRREVPPKPPQRVPKWMEWAIPDDEASEIRTAVVANYSTKRDNS